MKSLTFGAVGVLGACVLALGTPVASTPPPVVLTIGDAARLAAEQGAGPEAAQERVSAARARLVTAHADLLPSLSGAVGMTERTFSGSGLGIAPGGPSSGMFSPGGSVPGPVRTWDARLAARLNVIDPGALAGVRAAGGAVSGARAEARDASEQAAAAAALAYVRALRADGHVAAQQTDSLLAEDLLEIARDQRAAGLGTNLDEVRALARLAATRAQLIETRAERERARLELRRILALRLDAPLLLADSLMAAEPQIAEPDEEDIIARSLRQRADLNVLSARIDVARLRISSIRAERLPVLSVFGDYGSTGNDTWNLESTYTWGLQLTVPVFDGLGREGRTAAQRAEARELEVRRSDLAAQIALEVRESLVDLRSARQQIAASDERLRLARRELAQARDRLTAGVTDASEVITALLGMNEALAARVDARAAYMKARVTFARVQGAVTKLP